VSHVNYEGSCPLWRGTFLSNARMSQEKENESQVAIHTISLHELQRRLRRAPGVLALNAKHPWLCQQRYDAA
jgi:hypothetical protein